MIWGVLAYKLSCAPTKAAAEETTPMARTCFIFRDSECEVTNVRDVEREIIAKMEFCSIDELLGMQVKDERVESRKFWYVSKNTVNGLKVKLMVEVSYITCSPCYFTST